MSNNAQVNFNCPALMSDGRHGTDYRPRNDAFQAMASRNNLTDSYDTRTFLQNNATELIKLNQQYFKSQKGCESGKFIHPDPSGSDEYWREYRRRLHME